MVSICGNTVSISGTPVHFGANFDVDIVTFPGHSWTYALESRIRLSQARRRGAKKKWLEYQAAITDSPGTARICTPYYLPDLQTGHVLTCSLGYESVAISFVF
jgi:hypothetical protein